MFLGSQPQYHHKSRGLSVHQILWYVHVSTHYNKQEHFLKIRFYDHIKRTKTKMNWHLKIGSRTQQPCQPSH